MKFLDLLHRFCRGRSRRVQANLYLPSCSLQFRTTSDYVRLGQSQSKMEEQPDFLDSTLSMQRVMSSRE